MQTLEIVGALFGLLYLRLEYKASIWLWPVGVVMPLCYVYLFFVNKFYADMGINAYYFFASIYGWIRWQKQGTQGDEIEITYLPRRFIVPLSLVFLLLFVGIAWVLIRFTDSPVPYGDSFTTALSVVAMWMLANKRIEHWILWFVVNVVSVGLYFWKGLHPTAILFMIYSVVSLFGYWKWRQAIKDPRG